MEFEAAQKAKAAQMNITEDQNGDSRYLEAVKDESEEKHDRDDDESKEGAANTDGAAEKDSESESSEDTEGRQRRDDTETGTSNCMDAVRTQPTDKMYE